MMVAGTWLACGSQAAHKALPLQKASRCAGLHSAARPLQLLSHGPLVKQRAVLEQSWPQRCRPQQLPRGAHVARAAAAAGAGAPEGPSAAAVSTDDTPELPEGFYSTRFVSFLAMVTGYAAYYVTRNSLTYVAPFMLNDAAMGLSITQIGGLTSILPIAYGFSKFLSGVLGAKASPKVILAGGLMATAAVNVLFGFGASYLWFMVFWGFNGLLQGLGAPACARVLTAWFPVKERGTWWGFWTASNNVGGFLAPIVAGTAARNLGWRWGMFAPGIIGVTVGLIILAVMKDDPESAGYPPVESGAGSKDKAAAKVKDDRSLWQILVQECLRNPYVWLFAITYFFVYVVRQGVTSWFIFYLIKAKGVGDGGLAAVRVSGLELGGFVGSLTSGAVSDYLIRKNADGKKGNVGLRVQVAIACTVGIAASIASFWALPNVAWLQWLNVALVGAFLYGPQMLIGLCGAEVVSKSAVSAAQGFLGWIAYLGAASAGVPIAMIVERFGWNAYFASLLASCAAILLLLAPMANLKSYVQSQGDADQAKLKAA